MKKKLYIPENWGTGKPDLSNAMAAINSLQALHSNPEETAKRLTAEQ